MIIASAVQTIASRASAARDGQLGDRVQGWSSQSAAGSMRMVAPLMAPAAVTAAGRWLKRWPIEAPARNRELDPSTASSDRGALPDALDPACDRDYAGEAEQHAGDLSRCDGLVRGERDQHGEDRWGGVKHPGEPAGDVLLAPADEGEGQRAL